MYSSFIKMLHILIPTLGQKELLGDLGELKRERRILARQQQRKALLVSVALVPHSQKRAWPEVPTDTFYTALLSSAPSD